MTRRRSSAVLLGVRIAVLLATALVVASAIVLAHRRREGADQTYACPMHPQVRAAGTAPCPICGMALVPKHRAGHASGAGYTLPDGLVVPEEAIGQATRMVVSQAIVRPAWVEQGEIVSLLYQDELGALAPADTAVFRAAPPSGQPGKRPVRVALVAGRPRAWDQATSRVRWRVLDGARLDGRETGWLELAERDREVTVLPYQAIVPSPEGPHAFVVSADRRTIGRRPLTTGQTVVDFATVAAGLLPEERLVTAGALLFEAERRLGAPPPAREAPP